MKIADMGPADAPMFPWTYDELQQVGTDYESYEEVARYDERMAKIRNVPGEIDELLCDTKPSADCVALEIGCGTGEFGVAVAARIKRLNAVDVSAAMLDYARQKAIRSKIGNITWHHAGFLSCTFEKQSFDLIFTQLALHHLPDFWKSIAIGKIYHWLKPGGVFYLKDVIYPSDVDDHDIFFRDVLSGIAQRAGHRFTPEVVRHIKNEYSTLDWIMEGMLRRSGFKTIENGAEKGFIQKFICIK